MVKVEGRSHIRVKLLTDVCLHRGNMISRLIPIKYGLNSVKQFEEFEDLRIDNIEPMQLMIEVVMLTEQNEVKKRYWL